MSVLISAAFSGSILIDPSVSLQLISPIFDPDCTNRVEEQGYLFKKTVILSILERSGRLAERIESAASEEPSLFFLSSSSPPSY